MITVCVPKPTKNTDNYESVVSHPSHYTRGSIETIDYIEDKGLGFNLGNVVKYVSRAGYKDGSSMLTDLQKAEWYLQREIERVKKGCSE